MKQKPIDRRILKTRKWLSDSLVSLIIEKGYEAVTVQDIIDRANVGRSTFYAHFENKEQLLLAGHTPLRQILEDGRTSKENSLVEPDISFYALFEHIAENHQLAKAMIGKKSGEIVTSHLRDIMAIKISHYLKQQTQTASKMRNLIAEAAAAAMISLLTNWIEEGMPFTVTEIADKAQKLLMKMLD